MVLNSGQNLATCQGTLTNSGYSIPLSLLNNLFESLQRTSPLQNYSQVLVMSKKSGHISKLQAPPPVEEASFSEIPSLDKVQEHIERVREIMGQSPVTPGRQNLCKFTLQFKCSTTSG